MDENMNQLNQVFDVEPNEDGILEISQTVVPGDSPEPEDSDFNAARANTYELIDMSKAALQTAMLVSSETQNPRALEVLGQLLKTSADINRQLIQMSKDKQEVKVARKTASGKISNQPVLEKTNNVFVGTPADLNKIMAAKTKRDEDDTN